MNGRPTSPAWDTGAHHLDLRDLCAGSITRKAFHPHLDWLSRIAQASARHAGTNRATEQPLEAMGGALKLTIRGLTFRVSGWRLVG